MAKTKEELIQLKSEYETLNSKLKELTEEELREVVGGAGGKYITVIIPLTLPQSSSGSNKIDVYVDGEYKSNLSKEVDPIIGVVNIPIVGTGGSASVYIKIDGILYKKYSINFDNCSYNEM